MENQTIGAIVSGLVLVACIICGHTFGQTQHGVIYDVDHVHETRDGSIVTNNGTVRYVDEWVIDNTTVYYSATPILTMYLILGGMVAFIALVCCLVIPEER